MKHHLRFKHGKTEGEASSLIGMLMLAVIVISLSSLPLMGAAVWWMISNH